MKVGDPYRVITPRDSKTIMFYPYWAVENYFNPEQNDTGSMKAYIKFEKPFIALFLGYQFFQFKNQEDRKFYKILKFFHDNQIIATFEGFAEFETVLEENNE